MSMALDKVAFLPFGYMIDSWRWSVFDGYVAPANYTRHWWELRCKLQGIYPPVARGESDFDPGAKYHVAGNVAYIRLRNSRMYRRVRCTYVHYSIGCTMYIVHCILYNLSSNGVYQINNQVH